MDQSRRNFLKIVGLSLVSGGCTGSGFDGLPASSEMKKEADARSGRRWAMAVDISRCRQKDGCRECIDRCNTIHNIPAMENPAHEIKWIWKETFEHAFPIQAHGQPHTPYHDSQVLVMCNHCERPSCVRVCPTQATWKRKDGIVMMDQHRCIGCRYCMAACPYGSRSFNFVDPRPTLQKSGINPGYPTRTRGVVEKCSFCAERLARGKLPACVEVCPVKALVFGDLNDPESEVARLLEEKYTIRRKPGLGTNPHVFYLV